MIANRTLILKIEGILDLREIICHVYMLRHVATNCLLQIFCKCLVWFIKGSNNKPKLKFRTWPWPLTLFLVSFCSTKILNSKVSITYGLPIIITYLLFQIEMGKQLSYGVFRTLGQNYSQDPFVYNK